MATPAVPPVGVANKPPRERVATRQDLNYGIDPTKAQWDRAETINRMQQMVMEEERRRQQDMLKYNYGGPPPIFGGIKNGGNI